MSTDTVHQIKFNYQGVEVTQIYKPSKQVYVYLVGKKFCDTIMELEAYIKRIKDVPNDNTDGLPGNGDGK